MADILHPFATAPQGTALTVPFSLPGGEGGFSAFVRKDGRGITKNPEGSLPGEQSLRVAPSGRNSKHPFVTAYAVPLPLKGKYLARR